MGDDLVGRSVASQLKYDGFELIDFVNSFRKRRESVEIIQSVTSTQLTSRDQIQLSSRFVSTFFLSKFKTISFI